MANSLTTDLMSVGQHCAAPECGQIDFLPFKCDCCSLTFCLEHRTYESHACKQAGGRQSQTIVCPLCARAIKLRQGQDANEAFEQHQRSGCDTSNYNRVHKKPSCPVKGCREKLTTVNSYACKDCGLKVCLNHRLPGEHGCQANIAALRNEQRSNWSLSNMARVASSAMTSRSAPSAAPARIKSNRAATHSQQQGQEACPQCNLRFRSVQDLIRHVDRDHGLGAQGRADTEACPSCGQRFSDPVQLVNHVEKGRCSRRSACILA